ncbi:MAG: SDR family NAD(P)-dependent oxidoreductase [Sphaerospermopsis sp. SIO1G2]|nr:SDR family NAD(P)-dependent oxidoreductase [Sphaerospermopsis sp. SIO1G2]
MTQLEGKVIAITGATRGIGAAVAKRCAREGAHMVLIARSVEGLEHMDDAIHALGGKATLVPLDLAQHDMIDALGAAIYQQFSALDGLVANAAILGSLTPLTHITPAQFQQIFDVNVTANWRLLRILDPLLARAPHPRAVFVTSGITKAPTPYWGAYAASKAALESLVTTYAAETTHNSMRVNCLDPGAIATSMRAQAFPGEDASSLMQPDDERLNDAFVQLLSDDVSQHGERVTL